MNSKYCFLAFALGLSASAGAQEFDDMYFNGKDRLAQTESNSAALASRYQDRDRQAVNSNPVNPSDSYTGRGVNPEYNAQQKNGTTILQENPDYFLSNFQPKSINSSLYSGSNSSYSSGCNCGYGNPYGMGYGGFGNPYGGYSPYGYNGLTTSMGYGFSPYGSMWSMGLSYGMGSQYGSPNYGYNPYGYYGYPTTVVVTGADAGIGQAHGRRPTRASSVNTHYAVSDAVAGTHGRGRETTATRSTQSNYYNPGWRSDPGNFQPRNYGFSSRTNYPNGSATRSWSNNSRVRSFDRFGTGSRGTGFGTPSMGSSSGGSGGGRSRGRN